MVETATKGGPQPTRDLERALADLDLHGACIVVDALDADLLKEVHTALYRAAESDRKRGWRQDYQYGADDHVNQRIWNLPSHDPAFCELAEHPLAIDLVKRTLGWPASLSSMSANITNGGGASMMLHNDQGYLPGPLTRPWVYNLAWCIDAFTVAIGATLIAPGSLRLNGAPLSEEAVQRMIPVVAQAGSMIVLDGLLWHTNGINSCLTIL